MMEMLIKLKIVCFTELLLRFTKLDFELEPCFFISRATVPTLDVRIKLARFVCDGIREVDDLGFRK